MSVRYVRYGLLLALSMLMVLSLGIVPATASGHNEEVRFATFNASLNRFNRNDLMQELAVPGSAQPATIAEIIQHTRPDVVLINEFDWDRNGVGATRFQNNYLGVSQNGAMPIWYPYVYVAESNTGVPSGYDLDNSGSVGGPNDALGFGFFRGQFAFVVYSMYPIGDVRTFKDFLWKDMPDNLIPPGWYSPGALSVLPVSSKNHVDVGIEVGGQTVHFLASHPTPPVFDGAEDRNGRRNSDEIRFWADYVSGKSAQSGYIYDDVGTWGGLAHGDLFVIAGDQNADPNDGDSYPGAAQQILESPKVNSSMVPWSDGAEQASRVQRGQNRNHVGDPLYDTADFADAFGPGPDFGGAPGNLRVDYVLPQQSMVINDSGVFWPRSQDPLSALTGVFPFPSSDHRLVWIDAVVPNSG